MPHETSHFAEERVAQRYTGAAKRAEYRVMNGEGSIPTAGKPGCC